MWKPYSGDHEQYMFEKIFNLHYLIIFILGTIFGSFLNVVIYRLPKKISLIKPGSYCPKCKTKLKWFENVPVISFFLLRGKCSNCNQKISIQYLFIELVTGVIFVIVYAHSSDLFQFIFTTIMGMLFLCLVIIDFKEYILPDILLILIFLSGIIYFGYNEKSFVLLRILYGLVIGGSFYGFRYITSKFYKKITFGFGDVKLAAIIGFFLGIQNAYIAIFFGFILAAVIFAILIFSKHVDRNDYLPFGPYMIFGMATYFLYGDEIINWYLRCFI